jgi:DNA modification methylase
VERDFEILTGCCLKRLRDVPSRSVQCVVTSPPYWALRNYGALGQIGQEPSPEEYVAKLVKIFRLVGRCLKDDGTLWLNLGDTYAGGGLGGGGGFACDGPGMMALGDKNNPGRKGRRGVVSGLKRKDLAGIPWRVAFALQADGWYLRSDIIWHKPNPMPESITDRPTRAHEYIFLLTKSERYFYDADAIREKPSPALIKQIEDGYNGAALKDYLKASVQDASAVKSRIIDQCRKRIDKQRGHGRRHAGFNGKWDALSPEEQALLGSNKRDVWTVAPANYKDAHFATFPPRLIEPCILAGTRPRDVVLDPFGGSGTTAEVALQHGRRAILIELNPQYIRLIKRRIHFTKLNSRSKSQHNATVRVARKGIL